MDITIYILLILIRFIPIYLFIYIRCVCFLSSLYFFSPSFLLKRSVLANIFCTLHFERGRRGKRGTFKKRRKRGTLEEAGEREKGLFCTGRKGGQKDTLKEAGGGKGHFSCRYFYDKPEEKITFID